MSGHSKWANIKRTKGKSDAAKSKIFTKIGRELAVAVKIGGPDPDANFTLRNIILKARDANMPSDNISRTIKKASGELGSINYENIIYEGYGAGGTAVIIETLTDNKNRTAGDIRHIFDKCGGSMGTTGCVSYLFENKGVILIAKEKNSDDDKVMMDAIESGADDFSVNDDDSYEIITSPDKVNAVRQELETLGYKIESAQTDKIPSIYIELNEENKAKFERMLDMFDESDDVQNVFHNAEIDFGEEEDE